MAIIKRKYCTKKQQKPVIFYQAEVFMKGVRVSMKAFSTKKEAILWHEKEKQKFTFNPDSLNDQMLFKDCVDKYWKDIQTRMLQSTVQGYKSRLTYLYSGPLADIKMSELKGIRVVEWINWLKEQPTVNNKGRKSFVKDLGFLKAILNWYKNFVNEDFNVPVTKKHREICFFKSNPPRRPDYYMRPENTKKWVKWLKEHRSNPSYWRLGHVHAFYWYLCKCEACGLKWEEIDLDKGVARVIRRVRWDHFTRKPFLEEVTKTAQSTRLLMLPGKLKDILKEAKKTSVSDLVFTDNKGELLRYNAVQSAFNAGFVALNLPWRSTHICRHTYATIALMATKNISAVQASLGHTEIRMTQKYAKTVALLNHEVGEKTFSALFKNS